MTQHGVIDSRREGIEMDRITNAVALLLVAVFGFTMTAQAQTAEKTLHVGILSSGDLTVRRPFDRALVEGLRDQGYVEGRNLIIERRYGLANIDRNAAELAGMKLDAVLTTCTPSTRIMKAASSSTPIVMAAVSDPVRQGLIASFAKPGENVTGTSSQAEDLLPKRLQLLTEMLPHVRTVAVVANAKNPVHALGWQKLQDAARHMNVKLVKVEMRKPDDLPAAMEAAVQAQAGAWFVLPDDPLMLNTRPQMVELARKNHLPDFYWAREFVDSGGLMSYGENLKASYRAAATYMDKIRKGTNPALLPVEQPTHFEMVLNVNRAKALGIPIPGSVLLLADEVIR
jgi:putative ABC transport system substrate-binding protein